MPHTVKICVNCLSVSSFFPRYGETAAADIAIAEDSLISLGFSLFPKSWSSQSCLGAFPWSFALEAVLGTVEESGLSLSVLLLLVASLSQTYLEANNHLYCQNE